MIDETSSRRYRLVLPITILAITLPNLLKAREAWPIWYGMIVAVLPVVLGALLVAAAAAGFVAWRRGRHDA